MDALEKRNNTVHTYNQEILKETIRFLTEESNLLWSNSMLSFWRVQCDTA